MRQTSGPTQFGNTTFDLMIVGASPLDAATTDSPEVRAEIAGAFTYHAWTPDQVKAGDKIRIALAEAVAIVIANAPPSPDRSAAIRKIREARMDANSAITHGGRF